MSPINIIFSLFTVGFLCLKIGLPLTGDNQRVDFLFHRKRNICVEAKKGFRFSGMPR